MRDRVAEDGFAEFTRARWGRLVRLAYSLTLDVGRAEDLVQESLAKLWTKWPQVRDGHGVQLFKSYRKDYKDGEQKRDFLYVKDCVQMTLHLAATPRANGLFNIGSGGARSWIDLANAVFTATKKKPVKLAMFSASIRQCIRRRD